MSNIPYFFVIVNAVSQSGDSLAMPYSIEFTTGSSLPTASVSGTISFPGNDPVGTLVVLFDGDPFGDESNEKFVIVAPNSTGNYTIDYVESGYYWPTAVKNFYIGQSGELELINGGGLGFYNINADLKADSISVTSGATITNIDFPLLPVFNQTAREPYLEVEALAQSWSSDAYPVFVSKPLIEPNGKSLIGFYAFYSSSLMEYSGWFVAGDLIAVLNLGGFVTETIPLPTNWLDSDTIMAIAEENGGSDFRQDYPDAESTAMLGYLNFEDNNMTILNIESEMISNRFPTAGIFKVFNQHALGNSANNLNQMSLSLPAVWMVQYYSFEDNTQWEIIFDAVTGTILSEPVTASVAEEQAFPIAQSWSGDAKLWRLSSFGTTIDSLGNSQMWGCIYYSPSIDSLFMVTVMGQLPILSVSPGFAPTDTTTVTLGWVDSDVTIAVAEASGGETYRQTNQDVFVNAQLSRWFGGLNPALSIWTFEYTSSTSDTLVFLVNAHTGNIVGIDETEFNYLPYNFALYQNYPNPFNPTTTIKYALPENGFVNLVVYDLLGREVALLINEEQSAGNYEVSFNESGLASGVYIYKIKVNDFIESKKMILLR